MKLYGTRAHDRGFAHLVYWHDGACDSPLVRCACVRAGTRSKPNALQMLTARIPRSSPPLSQCARAREVVRITPAHQHREREKWHANCATIVRAPYPAVWRGERPRRHLYAICSPAGRSRAVGEGVLGHAHCARACAIENA